MNLATLRVEGLDSDLESLKRVLSLECETQWKKGEKRRNGRVFTSSGFSAAIADARTPRELMGLVRSFLTQCNTKNIVFPRLHLSAELAVAFTVGDSEQFTASVKFSPSELLLCAECGINLSVTAYPTSDEANATNNAT
jgi:hypothetical protein